MSSSSGANGKRPSRELGLDGVERGEQRVAVVVADDPAARRACARARATARRRGATGAGRSPATCSSARKTGSCGSEKRDIGRSSRARRRSAPARRRQDLRSCPALRALARPSRPSAAPCSQPARRAGRPSCAAATCSTASRPPSRVGLVAPICAARGRPPWPAGTCPRGTAWRGRISRGQPAALGDRSSATVAALEQVVVRRSTSYSRSPRSDVAIASRRSRVSDAARWRPASTSSSSARRRQRRPPATSQRVADPSRAGGAQARRVPMPPARPLAAGIRHDRSTASKRLGDARDLALGQLREERQRERARGDVLADRELALAVAEALAVEAHQVDRRQVGLGLHAALAQRADRRRRGRRRAAAGRRRRTSRGGRRRRPRTAARGPRCPASASR